ncbi:acyltransferase family protein [Mesorhizobium sp. INR15]|uniref:acyltransferase family protein n=1 Tax=Mesorhizobium sp. INR15 TaxID=2654248 RepID=UPI002155FC61|nr:acyltransferase family protein [Mesorhizobium sp. INR15]
MTAPIRSDFRPDIEGLRALAVAGVVAYHFGLTALSGGFAGVDIFFVISGYLITKHLLQEMSDNGRMNLWRFYARRARRLLPASLFVILATLAIGYFILSPDEQALYSKGAMFASAYMINFWLIRWSFDYFASDAANNPFIHFWSLSVEEQFYLCWPALLMLAAWLRPGRRAVALTVGMAGLASFIACAWLTTASPPWAFYFSPLRAWEFAAGGLATLAPATLWRNRRDLGDAAGWLGLALIAAAYLRLSEDMAFPGFAALLPVAGTVLVLLSGLPTTAGLGSVTGFGPRLALALLPFQWIGKLSYSLYLWHWPVIVYAQILMPNLTITQRLACAVLSLGLSLFTYHVIENPVRRNGWLMAGAARALVPALMLTGAGVVAAYASAHLATRNIGPQQRLLVQAAAMPSMARASDEACLADLATVTPKPCMFGAGDTGHTIVLFGDSHADHWSTPVIEAAKRNDNRVVTFLKSSCPASRMTSWSSRLKRDYTECDTWRRQAVAQILALKPRLVVMSEFSFGNLVKEAPAAMRDQQNVAWQAGLRETIETFSQAGIKVAVIRDVPINDQFANTCVARALWWGEAPSRCDTPRAHADNEATATIERRIVQSVSNTTYVDLTDRFCDQTTCHVFIDGKLAFRDSHHLTTAFAGTLEPDIERALFSKSLAAK